MRKSAHQGHKSERLRHNLNLIDRRDVLGLIVNIKETDSVTKEDKERSKLKEEKRRRRRRLLYAVFFFYFSFDGKRVYIKKQWNTVYLRIVYYFFSM